MMEKLQVGDHVEIITTPGSRYRWNGVNGIVTYVKPDAVFVESEQFDCDHGAHKEIVFRHNQCRKVENEN